MKQQFFAAMRSKGDYLVHATHILSLGFMLIVLFGSCQKSARVILDDVQPSPNHTMHADGNVLNNYTGLSAQTQWELQQARASTAKYRNINKAIEDGYADISVVVPNMGHHYLKSTFVDATFDYRKPEILVYNKEEDGSFELVAVEYAVPISLSPSTAPTGFTGSGDVWDYYTGFGLWLLHAWVWAYNPDGVFNPTNPSVHTH
jgi:hypothetical protein